MKIVDFARERGVEPSAVHKYLERNPILKEKCERNGNRLVLTEEVLKELDKQYPLLKPNVIINGIPEEEHMEVLNRLSKAQEVIIVIQNELTDQKLLVAEQKSALALLEDQQSRADEERERLEGELSQVKMELEIEKNKTWWDKLRRK